MVLPVLIYIGLCILVAYFGRARKMGFWGYLGFSLLIDPLVGLLLVLASNKRAPPAAASTAA